MMSSYSTGVLLGMAGAGAAVGAWRWKRPWYGLTSGLIHGVIAIGLKELIGKEVSALYLAGVVIYTVGTIGNKAAPAQKTTVPAIPQKTFWSAEDLKGVFRETMKAITAGCYTNSQGTKITLQSGKSLKNSSKHFDNRSPESVLSRYSGTYFSVENKNCLDTAEEYALKGKKVGVLNFSSPYSQSDGFRLGKDGLEEEICYRSELMGLMDYEEQEQPKYLEADRAKLLYPIEDRQIHTPEVLVFRAGKEKNYTFLDNPFRIGIVTSAARYTPALTSNGDYAKSEDEEYMRKQIFNHLYTFYANGYDTIIVGAFGCGAFKNPPRIVAKMYQEIIETYFKGAFQRVVFAILEGTHSQGTHSPTGNIKPFQERFLSKK